MSHPGSQPPFRRGQGEPPFKQDGPVDALAEALAKIDELQARVDELEEEQRLAAEYQEPTNYLEAHL